MPSLLNQTKATSRQIANAVYIGRPSKWGNPYKAGVDGTRPQVIEMYRKHLYVSGLINDIHELAGRDLLCWCYPKPCHGDVLMQLANAGPLEEFFGSV